MRTYGLYLNGKWTESSQSITVVNPATGQEIGQTDNLNGVAEFLDPARGEIQTFYRSRLIIP